MNIANILIIENESHIKDILNEEKNLFLFSNQKNDILNILIKHPIDLIFLDIDSLDEPFNLIEEIKNNKNYQDIFMYVLYTNIEEKKFKELLEFNFISFIKKPYLIEELQQKLKLFETQYKKFLSIKKELNEYKKVLDESDIVSKSDLGGKITYVNKKFIDISGYNKKELIGKSHNIVRYPDVPKETFKTIWETISNKKTFRGIIKNKKKDGSPYYVDATIVPILDIDGEIKEYIGVRHDITDIMSQRRQFLDDIKSSSKPIVMIGKIKNYTLLKEFYGEIYLQKVEDFLTHNLVLLIPNESPLKKVYQLDNGEFGFLREDNGINLTNIELCLKKFQNFIKSFDFIIDDKKIDIELVFAYTTEKKEAYENLKIGIYRAQKEKKEVLLSDCFSTKQRVKAENNMKIVSILKDAIRGNQAKIISYFQPILNNQTNEIEKYESLVRLVNSDGSIISPFFFIDIAKKAGYYKSVTNLVIENVQNALNKTDKDITLNLSTIDIEDLDTRNKLLDLMTKPQNYGRIVFELLEDETASDFNTVKNFISLAKVLGGVKIAIDDFGSGYSNFERLLDFQPDILKIDGSLIKNIVNNPFSKHVVESIILFAKEEKIETVAEFIADEDIFKEVKKLGIKYSQGYFIGKPAEL